MAEKLYYATGKRKTAIARVWMRPGKGNMVINDSAPEKYFDGEVPVLILKKPLMLTETMGNLDISVNVAGGGKIAQAGAVRHGIAKALLEINPEYRATLKKAGLLTRDPRAKERKKYGQKGARARFHYSKR
ncbi:MAG: 30S ribosomal protein S9 [Deltaproteobacteria bacterium]|nr:30S ribosomal protein S9 [Deltaproteobacteria bacterium]